MVYQGITYHRDKFWTLSNIYDEAFFDKTADRCLFWQKKLHHRCFKGYYIHHWNVNTQINTTTYLTMYTFPLLLTISSLCSDNCVKECPSSWSAVAKQKKNKKQRTYVRILATSNHILIHKSRFTKHEVI